MYDETTKQVKVTFTNIYDEVVTVNLDEPIAPLIVALNEKGFFTQYCCNGHEEDNFACFYIMFYPLNSTQETILKIFIQSISDIYTEYNYNLYAPSSISNNYIQLVDPTEKELEMAKRIVFRHESDNEDLVSEHMSRSIIIRPKFLKTYQDGLVTDFEKFRTENKLKVANIIKRLTELVNTLD